MRELPWDFNDPETLVNFNDFCRTGPPGSSPRKNIHDNNDGNFGRTEFPDTFPYHPYNFPGGSYVFPPASDPGHRESLEELRHRPEIQTLLAAARWACDCHGPEIKILNSGKRSGGARRLDCHTDPKMRPIHFHGTLNHLNKLPSNRSQR